MNLAFNPVTRRAFRANYRSPDICQPMAAISSSSGSGGSISGVLDFTNEASVGPTLSISLFSEVSFLLTWTSVPEAVYYNLYRGSAPGGPFVRVVEGVAGVSYNDVPGGSGPFYYYVTALEPAYGETQRSNVVVGSFETVPPLPIALGSEFWVSPESRVYSDVAGTIPSTPGAPIRFWEDLSGNGRHATMPNLGATADGPLYGIGNLDGFREVDFQMGIRPDTATVNRCALLTPEYSFPPTSIGSGGVTMFVVCKFNPSAGEDYGNVLGWRSREITLRKENFNPRMSAVQGGVTAIGPTGGFNTTKIYALRFTDNEVGEPPGYGNEVQLHVNSLSFLYRAVTLGIGNTTGKLSLGFAEDLTTGAYFGGTMVEAIMFGRSLFNAEMESVFSYLHTKYPSL